jgi:uncharacterized protein involved in cysteine biosynthesis
MIIAFALALAQLTDRRIVAVLLKSAGLTLVAVGLLGWGLWAGSASLLDGFGLDTMLGDDGTVRGFLSFLAAMLGVWLLFRLVALAVMQLSADEVVAAVEARHYPEIAARAQPLGMHREVGLALRSTLRSLLWNLAALPVALVLIVTGVGPLLVFAVVNAMLLGRELTETVRIRHRDARGLPLPDLSFTTRFVLGAICVGLLTLPFVNLLASVLGAAMATHLVHRRRPV